jgi:dihydroflavonol-4-reductase
VSTALITGGTGFLGRHLVAYLRHAEPATRLRLLCRDSTTVEQDPGVEVVRGEVTDQAAVLTAMEGVDVVYHLAGRISRQPTDRRALFTVHVEGARNVCAAAARVRPERLVIVSTSGTIAVSRRPMLLDERAPYPYELVNRWPYYLSKLYAEKLVLSATAEHGLPTVIVNPSLVLGPDGGRSSTNAVLAPFLDPLLPIVPRGGISFVDVRDVAASLPAAAARGGIGQRYLLAAANWSFRDLARQLDLLTGERVRRRPAPPTLLTQDVARLLRLLPGVADRFQLHQQALEMAAHFWYADASKARAELGFAPRDPAETLSSAVLDLWRSGAGR